MFIKKKYSSRDVWDLLTLTRCSVCEGLDDIGCNTLISGGGIVFVGTGSKQADTFEALRGIPLRVTKKTYGEMTNRSRNT